MQPGTLYKSKLEMLKQIGVTRLSLGMKHLDDDILKANGDAIFAGNLSRLRLGRGRGTPTVNIDLIAGMMGESEGGGARQSAAPSVAAQFSTIYQMELPFNTLISQEY